MAATSREIIAIGSGGQPSVVPFDAEIFGTGTLAERPASGSGVGDMYVVNDTGLSLYRIDIWDGSSWQPTGAAGFFGDNFETADDPGQDDTTSTTYQQKLRFTTTTLAVGTYFLLVGFSLSADAANKNVEWRIQVDDTTDLIESIHRTALASNLVPFTVARPFVVSSSASFDFDLDWRRTSGGPSYTASIADAVFILWRVI